MPPLGCKELRSVLACCFTRQSSVHLLGFSYAPRIKNLKTPPALHLQEPKGLGSRGAGRHWSVEAAGGKLKYLIDLFARDVELLSDFVDRGAGFEVFEYGGDGHARVAKHPCTAQAAGNAFDGRTLRPIKCRHLVNSFHC